MNIGRLSRVILIVLLVYMILEASRLLLLYSNLSTASQQAVRYGSASGLGNNTIPRYQDCDGIRSAAKDAVYLGALDAITIQHDLGPSTLPTEYCFDSTDTSYRLEAKHTDRILVTVSKQFTPILVPFFSRTISATSSRTILSSVSIAVTSSPSSNSPTPGMSSTLSIADQFATIDDALKQSVKASIAYNAPAQMKLDESTTIELLLNPAISPQAIASQVTENGQVVSSSIEVTPRMKAVLKAQEQDAFDIRPLQDNTEQIISGTETTKWSWFVTAKKSGTHRLTIIISRLIRYDGQDYWREVETYNSEIDVNVTLAHSLETFDWKWIIGVVIPLIGAPSLWSYIANQKKKRKKQTK